MTVPRPGSDPAEPTGPDTAEPVPTIAAAPRYGKAAFALIAGFLLLSLFHFYSTLHDPNGPRPRPTPVPATKNAPALISTPSRLSVPDTTRDRVLAPVPATARLAAPHDGAARAAALYAVAMNTFRWDEPVVVRMARVRAVTAPPEQGLAVMAAADPQAQQAATRNRVVSVAAVQSVHVVRASRLYLVEIAVKVASTTGTVTTPCRYAITVVRTGAGWRVVRAEGANRGLPLSAGH